MITGPVSANAPLIQGLAVVESFGGDEREINHDKENTSMRIF